MSLVRVDHAPDTFFATSFFRVDNGLITALDEFWADVASPPAWRSAAALAGVSRFEPRDDPRARAP